MQAQEEGSNGAVVGCRIFMESPMLAEGAAMARRIGAGSMATCGLQRGCYVVTRGMPHSRGVYECQEDMCRWWPGQEGTSGSSDRAYKIQEDVAWGRVYELIQCSMLGFVKANGQELVAYGDGDSMVFVIISERRLQRDW
ncbi:hypothetical protein K439DRAFT_1539519 [Ramaria rubella]|nr:hypothetical protein K439DRAFT_1539519 [Ramaria rubella]